MGLFRKVKFDGTTIVVESLTRIRKYSLVESAAITVSELAMGLAGGLGGTNRCVNGTLPRWAIKPLIQLLIPYLTEEAKSLHQKVESLEKTVLDTREKLAAKSTEVKTEQGYKKGLVKQNAAHHQSQVDALKSVIARQEQELSQSKSIISSMVDVGKNFQKAGDQTDRETALVNIRANNEVLSAHIKGVHSQATMVIVLHLGQEPNETLRQIALLGEVDIPNSSNPYLTTKMKAVVI